MIQVSIGALPLVAMSVLVSIAYSAAQENKRASAPPDAKIFFVDLKDGAKIPAKSIIRFGVSGMEITPAGDARPNTGHHHLLIDTSLPSLGREIPSDFSHLHFGRGQTEVELSLTPGKHTLQLLLGDHKHVPHDPAVFSNVIHVQVDAATVEKTHTPAPPEAKVFFLDLPDGATLPLKSIIKFGISGMEVAPAGTDRPNSGHHHLLVDTPLPPLDHEIPSDPNHLHFGRGQTSTELTLTPGEHTLQLLLGDHQHVPHDPPIMSNVLRVYAVEGTANVASNEDRKLDRQPSPPDAKVYFIYPHNGEIIYPNSTIRFGLSNMGVAPAGVRKPNTGHHHLIIDDETPELYKPIPNDPNHLHFGAGQTEKKITLTPGPHTLQLVLADYQHVPHDPPVISERIQVTVGFPRTAKNNRLVRKRGQKRVAQRIAANGGP
jgi:hypothetical protein